MHWTLLPSDGLLLAFSLALAGLAWWLKLQPAALHRGWQKLCQDRIGMAAATLLLCFMVVAVLDSIHIQTHKHLQPQLQSVLDKLIAPIGQNTETTYSAPFATHSFAKVTQTHANGEVSRTYTPLHYAYPTNKLDGLACLGLSLLSSAVLLGLIARLSQHQQPLKPACLAILKDKTPTAWRSIWLVLSCVALLVCFIHQYAGNTHILGTDKVGQDILYQALKSIRTGLIIGTITTLIGLPLAMLFGVLAGYFGGWVDDVIQYLYTTLSAVPGVLLISAAVLSLQVTLNTHSTHFSTLSLRADMRLLALCAILGLTGWPGLCRLIRGETLKLRETDYITAAKVMGVQHGRILMRHIVPNVMHIVIISTAIDFSGLVLAEAVLSYVGVGVDPTTISWGNMINAARLELARDPIVWWPLFAAFAFMFCLVLSANLFADSVRDAFDPKVPEGNQ